MMSAVLPVRRILAPSQKIKGAPAYRKAEEGDTPKSQGGVTIDGTAISSAAPVPPVAWFHPATLAWRWACEASAHRTPDEDPDALYAPLMEAHRALDEAASRRLDAKLVLILAMHVGDADVLREALSLATGGHHPSG
jgi:hypothetical protein